MPANSFDFVLEIRDVCAFVFDSPKPSRARVLLPDARVPKKALKYPDILPAHYAYLRFRRSDLSNTPSSTVITYLGPDDKDQEVEWGVVFLNHQEVRLFGGLPSKQLDVQSSVKSAVADLCHLYSGDESKVNDQLLGMDGTYLCQHLSGRLAIDCGVLTVDHDVFHHDGKEMRFGFENSQGKSNHVTPLGYRTDWLLGRVPNVFVGLGPLGGTNSEDILQFTPSSGREVRVSLGNTPLEVLFNVPESDAFHSTKDFEIFNRICAKQAEDPYHPYKLDSLSYRNRPNASCPNAILADNANA